MAIFAVHYRYEPAQADLRTALRPEHRQWLTSLVEAKQVLSSGPYADNSGALILVEAETAAAAQTLMAQDPFNREGLIPEVRIQEWVPVLGAFAQG